MDTLGLLRSVAGCVRGGTHASCRLGKLGNGCDHHCVYDKNAATGSRLPHSQSTRDEDLADKKEIYQDEIAVAEYFLFDPRSEYLNPLLQGYRLNHGRYVPIEPVAGRLPSRELGLHIEADGSRLRLYDPASQRWLLTPDQTIQEKEQARLAERQARLQERRARLQESVVRRQAEAEVERLRRELADLKRQGDSERSAGGQ